MSWRFWRRSSPPPRHDRAAVAAAPEAESRYASPGLKLLLATLPRSGKIDVLDLGMVSPENLSFFAERAVRLQIADLAASLSQAGSAPGIDVPENQCFDAILAWDLFDYLENGRAAALAAQLATITRPSGKLFLLASHQKVIPDQPLQFKLGVDADLSFRRTSDHSRLGPRRSAREIALLFSGFHTQASFLLRNGWQEFVLERDPWNNSSSLAVP